LQIELAKHSNACLRLQQADILNAPGLLASR
jgi:hypothetical protein